MSKSKRAPNQWRLKGLIGYTENISVEINGKWVPRRPMGVDTIKSRLKLAIEVFKGKADALYWPEGQ